jgi:hemerythrin
MEWSDAMSTGVPVLDTQHRALFDCVNDLESAAADGGQLLTIHAIDQLRTYVRFHFSTEEQLMRVHSFPRLKEHMAEHRKFATKLFELMMENTRRDNLAEMIAFLTNWLADHVARTDMEYVPYVTRQTDCQSVAAFKRSI